MARAGCRTSTCAACFDAFCEVYAPAAELMREGVPQGGFKGAPLRCTAWRPLEPAWHAGHRRSHRQHLRLQWRRHRQGDGNRLLAAQALLAHRGADGEAAARRAYATALAGLQPRFDLYEKASHVNLHPWITDLVIWRAHRSASIRRRLAGMLEETSNPGHLFSWRGMSRLFFE
jgi:hypothetical protein